METDQRTMSHPETERPAPRAAPKKPRRNSPDPAARLAQLLQKQSTQLDRISRTLEKQNQLFQQMKSSVNGMEKRLRATEKMDSTVFEWVNRKIAKKQKKKKSKKR